MKRSNNSKKEKTIFKKPSTRDKAAIDQLENLDSLEKYARENYGHKRKDETIFIVED